MRTLGSFPIFAFLFVPALLSAEPKGEAGRSVAKPNVGATSTNTCNWSGVTTPALAVPIVDSKGNALARFGGVPVQISVSDFPEQALGRLHVITGGDGRLSVDGYVEVKSLPMYVKNDVAVVEGHVVIVKGTRIEYAGSTADQLRVKLTLDAPLRDTFTTTIGCGDVTFEPPNTDPWKFPGHARGYVMKVPSAPLFDVPGAKATVLSTLHRAPDSHGVLFFGDRREGDYIHVLYRRDVKIDGWMSVKDLELLPKGELLDQRTPRAAESQDSRLSVASDARLVRATENVPLYGKADPKLSPIGVVSKNTELYVLDVVVGWANVLPKHLDVVPMAERRFWVRASGLNL